MKQDVIVNIYKPKGMSSFQCVSMVKRKTGIKKAGHAGTLDPNAEGVLPVLLGKATKCNDFFMEFDKGYKCDILFGTETDTGDIWGNTIRTADISLITKESLTETLNKFTGNIKQVPPMYSAIKRDGVPLYKLARKGMTIDIEPRNITVYSIDLLDFTGNSATIQVKCSKGTYIRSLCRDIGVSMNSAACMSGLIRTHYGPFTAENAISPYDVLNEEKYFDLDSILTDYPSVLLNDKQRTDYIQGKEVILDDISNKRDIVKLYYNAELIAIAKTETTDNRTKLIPWKYFG